jgi:hypothetical protein
MMTAITLVQFIRVEETMTGMTTLGTNKAVWPAPIEERFFALFLRTVFLKKIRQTESFLELDCILRHRKSLYISST